MRVWQSAVVVLICAATVASPSVAQTKSAGADLKLIDEIPDLPGQLVSQWDSDDHAPGTAAAIQDTEYYGRLRDLAASQKLTLADCVALAIANNTQLQIARLGPLGARVQIRKAQSVFDPALFANVGLDRYRRQSASYAAVRSAELNGVAQDNLDPYNGSGPLAYFLGPPESKQHRTTGGVGLHKISALTGAQLSLDWRNQRRGSNSPFQQLSPEYTTELEVSLNQPLLRDFGLRFTTLQVRVARTGAEAATKQYEAALSDLIKRVETAYWLLVGTKENVVVRELGVQVASELQRQNEGKFAVGTVPRTAVLEAKADVARREADLIQANKLHTNARDALRAILNVKDPDSDSLIVVEPSDMPEQAAVTIDLDQSLKTALLRRAELAAAKLGVKTDGMQLEVAENQLLPKLNAFGSFGTSGLGGNRNTGPSRSTTVVYTDQTQIGRTRDVLGADDIVVTTGSPYNGSYADTLGDAFRGDFYSYAAGLILEIPLDNAQAKAQYAQSRVAFEQSRLSLRQLQEAVTAEIKKSVNDLEADTKAIEATHLARELAAENVHNQQARYDVGLGTTKDLLDFQDALTQARAEEVRALTQYRIDLAELRRTEGTLLDAHHVDLSDQQEEGTPWWAEF